MKQRIFNYGNVHFVVLGSYETTRVTNGAMLTWLRNDLAQNTLPWVIAFLYHPPYTKGSHNSDTESELIEMRQNALPILEDAGVDLVLTGHSHSYERSFLIDGHYGTSSTFNATMKIDGGSGHINETGEYQKPDDAAHAGAVYVVAGSLRPDQWWSAESPGHVHFAQSARVSGPGRPGQHSRCLVSEQYWLPPWIISASSQALPSRR